ncbi:hypothetical protein KL906_003376 [Ogataea polymorpha]|nr:hypothetical protein KL906_003376 [Ogataea polymorpha]
MSTQSRQWNGIANERPRSGVLDSKCVCSLDSHSAATKRGSNGWSGAGNEEHSRSNFFFDIRQQRFQVIASRHAAHTSLENLRLSLDFEYLNLIAISSMGDPKAVGEYGESEEADVSEKNSGLGSLDGPRTGMISDFLMERYTGQESARVKVLIPEAKSGALRVSAIISNEHYIRTFDRN